MKIPVKYLKMSAVGLGALALAEGFRGTTYFDTVGVKTIGYGHTKGVKTGDTITPEKALSLLIKEVDDAHGIGMKKCMGNIALTQNQYDAFLSFTYNVGVAGFCSSVTRQLLNEGKVIEACKAMAGWMRPPEIRSRREGEIALCLRDYT